MSNGGRRVAVGPRGATRPRRRYWLRGHHQSAMANDGGGGLQTADRSSKRRRVDGRRKLIRVSNYASRTRLGRTPKFVKWRAAHKTDVAGSIRIMSSLCTANAAKLLRGPVCMTAVQISDHAIRIARAQEIDQSLLCIIVVVTSAVSRRRLRDYPPK